MSRIGPTLSSIEMSLLDDLAEAQAGLALTSLQLGEGKNVVAPWVDPSRFMAIARLESDLDAVTSTMKNVTAADSLMTQTDAVLSQMLEQLDIIQTQLESDADQSLTPEQRAAAQVAIDDAIEEINALASTTIDGRARLEGSTDYEISGRNTSQVGSFRVFNRVDVGQSTPKKAATFTYTGTDRYATDDATITLRGDGASHEMTITAGQTLESIAKEINDASSTTSLVAAVDGNTLTIESANAGADRSLSLLVTSGSFAASGESSQTTTAKTAAQFTYTGDDGKITDDATFEITGELGTRAFTVGATDNLTTVADAINAEVLNTGVRAEIAENGNQLLLVSAESGSDQSVVVTATSGTFDVASTAAGGTTATTRGELTYTGAAGMLADDVEFDLTGNDGTVHFTLTTADSLQDAADAINLESANTGVSASVDGDELTLQTVGDGSDQFVRVDVSPGSGDFIVTAGNSTTAWGTTTETTHGTTTQTTVGQDAVQAAVATVSGTVHKSATRAELAYTGSGGAVQAGDHGDLTITGTDGSATITVTALQTLGSLATAINNQSDKTGVEAELDGDTLMLKSIRTGSDQSLAVSSTGTFLDNVSGGRGDGTAYGTDAVATINGFDYTPDTEAELRHRSAAGLIAGDATLTLTGDLGSANFTLTTGQTLSQVAALVNAQTAAIGVYASVDENDLVFSSTESGSSADVQLNVTSGTFDLVAGFDTDATAAQLTYTGAAGDFGSYPANFTLTGPDGAHVFNFLAGTSLSDAADSINLETAATGVTAAADGDSLVFTTVDKGSAVAMSVVGIAVTGGNGDGTADGTDAVAAAQGEDGRAPMGWLQGSTLGVNQNGFHYQIEFVEGFTGDFTPISVRGDGMTFALSSDLRRTTSLALPSLLAENLGGVSGALSDLASGGTASGLENNTSLALRIVKEATADVELAQAQVQGLRSSAIDTASALLEDQQTALGNAITETDGYMESHSEALQSYYEALVSNTMSGLVVLYSQRASIADLLQQVSGWGGSS